MSAPIAIRSLPPSSRGPAAEVARWIVQAWGRGSAGGVGMAQRRGWMGFAVGAIALVVTACGPDEAQEAERAERLATIEREASELNGALSHLEARLHVNRARVATWKVLGERHRGISAIACEVADSHMLSMVKHVQKNDKKKKQAWKRRRVARAAKEAQNSGTGGGR